MPRLCTAGRVEIGESRPPAIIAGPCLLESLELGLTIGRAVRDACEAAGLPYIFKASFDKANRSSIRSARGPGLERGLAWLAQIRETLGVPVTTDLHEPAQAEPVAQAVDVLQIPAFLCRQTDLLVAAGEAAVRRGRAVNVKKGQFMSPGEMAGAVRKLTEAGCGNVMLTERGTSFGYHRLVNDFIGLGDLMELDLSKAGGGGSAARLLRLHALDPAPRRGRADRGPSGTGPAAGARRGRGGRARALPRVPPRPRQGDERREHDAQAGGGARAAGDRRPHPPRRPRVRP